MNLTQWQAEAIVAGHICLDVIPEIASKEAGMGALLIPGKLVEIGPAVISTGGAVSNTGLALHRLGVPTKLMGKVGNDGFGRAIIETLDRAGPGLSTGMIVAPGEHSSYTLVISPPQVDRIFLHCTGANDTFSAEDINAASVVGSRLFHFGYPPLMRNMFADGGQQLASLLSVVKSERLTISLDLAKPDPESAAGRADWRAILTRALPYVDIFLPSFEEILYMLRRDLYDRISREHGGTDELLPYANGELLSLLADELIAMGAAIVALKLGEHGLYVKTTSDANRLKSMGYCAPEAAQEANWLGREMLAPVFEVNVVGTTGAGDCTIAGFLAGLLKGLPLETTLRSAVAVGAHNVEQADAVSGVPTWDKVMQRMKTGWRSRKMNLSLEGWQYLSEQAIWMKS
jgi:sugar/nucleoside kinase (ribokinase family)